MNKIKDDQLILITEDNDDDFESTMRALNKVGEIKNPIIRCENGQDLLDYLRQKGPYKNTPNWMRPAIILLDLNMPGIDGRTALKEIKTDPDLKDIPVIILTTSSDSLDIDACYQDGANTYIHKPLNLDVFFNAIKKLMDYWLEVAILPKTSQ